MKRERGAWLTRCVSAAVLSSSFWLCTHAHAQLAPVQGTNTSPPSPDVALTSRHHIGRTLRLLATSTPQQRKRVTILLYGQSVTEGSWSKRLAAHLRARYPHADLVIENRALGGFASQLLVNDAETDLYPVYPDLIIFHVFGDHQRYEDIIRRVRERTTSEIMIQNDLVLSDEELNEETDATKLWPDAKRWASFMNYFWLPKLARRYGALLCDVRGAYKRHLTQRSISVSTLEVSDGHANARGNALIFETTRDCMFGESEPAPAPAESWVHTLHAGKDFVVQDGKLSVAFEGNRIDVIGMRASKSTSHVRIDGKLPSQWQELYAFTRALPKPRGRWPALLGLSMQALPQVEQLTLTLTKQPSDHGELYTFGLKGSRTGADGNGRSDQRFVSTSGRVVIDPEDFNVAYALELARIKRVPERVAVRFAIVPRFVDSFRLPRRKRAGSEVAVTLAQGLPNTPHVLELQGDDLESITALRVYRPSPPAVRTATTK